MGGEMKGDSKYSAPKLVIYGDMAKLTASGAGSMTENNPGQTGKKPGP
jgi:hypothetical protein